jgi:peptidoglycan/LPS O-acetylase OafA/YrhL
MLVPDSRPALATPGLPSAPGDGRRRPRRLGHRPVLDGLRGLSVLLVIGVHVGLLENGYIGVDLFFALSGFLITVLLCEEWDQHGKLSLRRFYARRARRLVPALTVLVVGFVALSAVVATFSATAPTGTLVGTSLLFVNNWVATLLPAHGRALGPLSPTWSLAQEGQFYLLWPVVLWILLRLRRRPSFVLGVLALWMLALFAAVPLVHHAYPSYGTYTSPLDRSAELLLGCVAAIVWRERYLPSLLMRSVAGWLAAAGLALVLVEARAPQRPWYLLTAALAALLIISLLATDERRVVPHGRFRRAVAGAGRPLAAALSSRPLRFTGRISYGIYLYHLPIYYLLLNYLPGRSPYFYGPLVLAASLAAAVLSWKLLELPIIRHDSRAWRVAVGAVRRHLRWPAPVAAQHD